MTKYIELGGKDDVYTISGKLSDDIFLRGNAGNDRIVDAHDGTRTASISGGDGNDVIIGGAHTTRMWGGNGDDFFALKGLTTRVGGGAGYDIVQLNTELYDKLGDDGVVYMGTGKATALLTEAGLRYDPSHYLSLGTSGDVERMQTAIYGEGSSRGGLDLIGDNADNVLRGGAAENVLHGAGGNDTLFGFGGADRLYGGTGNDSLNGGLGADILSGGSGNDTLFLDEGDTATGGSGRDWFQALTGSFTITDFAKGVDQINLVGMSGAVAIDPSHVAYTVDGTTYRIEFGTGVDALGLSVGHSASSDIIF